MAEIRPFRALHYDTQIAGDLSKLVTQPYDKITPEMQARYYEASPYNLARIIRRLADPAGQDPYAAAAREFRGWIEQGILAPGAEPALCPYDQEYAVPGQAAVRKRRRGFIGTCRIEDYSAGIVHRHEETLSGPKADRLALLRATRAHFGQIFLLYSDPDGVVERELDRATRSLPPWESVEDEYGTRHEVWRLAEGPAVARIQDAMRDRKLVIADGHHRYETALAYRNSQRSEGKGGGASEFVMATLVRMESDGLVILPTHRVVHGLQDFDWTRFLSAAEAFFEVTQPPGAPESSNLERLRTELARAGEKGPAFVAYAGHGRAAILKLRDDAAEKTLADVPPGLRRLDVVVLHHLVLERVLGIDRDAVREERNLHYEREMDLALRAVTDGGAQICFLMNPTPIEAVRDNAFAGQVMPQKSTDFYPKLLSGLTIFDLEG
jgi:uncharacterized protein (DUF1015 family)